ncbi:hypothetical protein GWO43_19565 [candidate division KSB1 bacterium]|nr:hypothetical protein [candidate division KSB1 bacterium]NIR71378.1 hypothetical protein [candidate division KSB1 bacterium]NIS26272.1 hypothetical protein [candidate division KSB1 bacterium]NIT73034.1 hypothetical protein [candidate division KSB1 bacterium]NIU26942.1 hypothetical protein [candidate division KSB1 bacterium]
MTKPDKKSLEAHHELTDVKFRPIFWSVVGLFILVAFALMIIMAVFGTLQERQEKTEVPSSPLSERQPLPPQPRLQVTPDMDLEQFETLQDSLLNSYGWIVREAGVVRIPIDRAIQLKLERGFPARQNYRKMEEGNLKIENRESKIDDGDSDIK